MRLTRHWRKSLKADPVINQSLVIVSLYNLMKKKRERIRDEISAMGNANHTLLNWPIFDSSHADGIRTISCRPTDTIRE